MRPNMLHLGHERAGNARSSVRTKSRFSPSAVLRSADRERPKDTIRGAARRLLCGARRRCRLDGDGLQRRGAIAPSSGPAARPGAGAGQPRAQGSPRPLRARLAARNRPDAAGRAPGRVAPAPDRAEPAHAAGRRRAPVARRLRESPRTASPRPVRAGRRRPARRRARRGVARRRGDEARRPHPRRRPEPTGRRRDESGAEAARPPADDAGGAPGPGSRGARRARSRRRASSRRRTPTASPTSAVSAGRSSSRRRRSPRSRRPRSASR